ncbi:MAG: NifU family protein [Desulfoplanes sp.]|nr:NifU family protein [Desulfoplanes sp.]MDD4649115.1 NifU family protein [Desulfoplanes sp.]
MELKDKILAILDKIRPALQTDGGDVEFVELTADNVVKVRLQGACKGCPMSQMTLKQGIEKFLLKEIPEIKAVESAE